MSLFDLKLDLDRLGLHLHLKAEWGKASEPAYASLLRTTANALKERFNWFKKEDVFTPPEERLLMPSAQSRIMIDGGPCLNIHRAFNDDTGYPKYEIYKSTVRAVTHGVPACGERTNSDRDMAVRPQ